MAELERMQPDINLNHDYTITEWCKKRRCCRSTFYNLKAAGLGPKLTYIGSKVIVTRSADQEWEERQVEWALRKQEAAVQK